MAPAESHKDSKPKPSIEPKQQSDSIHPSPKDTRKASKVGRDIPASNNARSWYGRSWPRKAAPVTQVARESISAASDAASHLVAVSRSSYLMKSSKTTSGNTSRDPVRSKPADATTTMVNISSDLTKTTSSPDVYEGNNNISRTGTSVPNGSTVHGNPGDTFVSQVPSPDRTLNKGTESIEEISVDSAHEASSTDTRWFGWMPWTGKLGTVTSNAPGTLATSSADSTQDAAQVSSPQPEIIKPTGDDEGQRVLEAPQKRSWLSLWGPGTTVTPHTAGNQITPKTDTHQELITCEGQNRPTSLATSAEPTSEHFTPPKQAKGGVKSSGWAFWSRDRSNEHITSTSSTQEVGELAVSDTLSQQHPKRASISLEGSSLVAAKTKAAQPDKLISSIDRGPIVAPSNDPSNSKQKGHVAHTSLERSVPNLLLPSFKDTFQLQDTPSILQQIGRYFNLTRLPETRHVHTARDPVRVKKCLAIGIHGYFPAPLIRTVLGQPTGTSIKFAAHAAQAIRRWSDRHGFDCEIEKVALEGEGRIAERLDILWKLLLNWMDHIRKADFIMIAAHSQGVPVAIMLVEKLISFGCVSTSRISVCAMAGVNLGPFPEYRSRWISGSAGELFDFSNPESKVSQDYIRALTASLKFGVRVIFAGSIDDQLVSLESSLLVPAAHPYIYRAVFVDGRVHAPSFLSHLVGFALKLRNLGFSDHGLIRELSSPLAGSLYTGEGHSRLYDEESIYDLGVEFALETSSINDVSLQFLQLGSTTSHNPYILPFAMRGLLEEEYVRTALHDEMTQLLEKFDQWKPSTKSLKDVKFRLEGIRSKL